MSTEKRCSVCEELLPIERFNKKSSSRDGYEYFCRECAKQFRNNDRRREIKRENYYNHWAYSVIDGHIRRGMEVHFDRAWLEQRARDTPQCELCGIDLRWEPGGRHAIYTNTPTLDRISNGLIITEDNTMILCNSCNAGKGVQSLDEYIAKCVRIAKKYYKLEMI